MDLSSENNADTNFDVNFIFGKIYFYHGETMDKRRILLEYLRDKNYKMLNLLDINDIRIAFPWCVFSFDDEFIQNLPKFYNLKFSRILKSIENSKRLRLIKSNTKAAEIQAFYKNRFLFQIYLGIITGSDFLYIEIPDYNNLQVSYLLHLINLIKIEKITVIFSSDIEINEMNEIFDYKLILSDKDIRIENVESKIQSINAFTIKAGSTITISCDELKLKEFLFKIEKICDIKFTKIKNSKLTEIFFETSLNPDETEKIMKLCEKLEIEIKVIGGD